MSLYTPDWASKWALYHPDKIALKEYATGRTLTYGELNRLGNRLANHLRHHYGLQGGDRVAVLAENCLEYLLLFVAAQKTGLVLVPLNYRLAPMEWDYLLRDADPRLLIVEEPFQMAVEQAPHYRRVAHHWTIAELREFCVAPGEDQPFDAVVLSEDDPIFLLYTSGTTGFPKGALYTHQMLFWNSINTTMSLIINGESRTINCMPPFHTGGWNVLTTPLLHHGGYTCLLKNFDAATVLRLLEEERPTIFMGVPTMLKMMADLPAFATTDFSSLYYIIVGGEPMPIPLIEAWHGRGVPIRQGYGMTEVGPNLTSLHQDDSIRKIGSIGRPNFYVQTKIVDEHLQPVPPGESGELLLAGPMVTPGYWNNAEATAKAFADGWFRTGDRVRQDEEGYLYVIDRIKNMFISGGENVYPAEVERVLITHPAVAEVVVIGVPDDKWGEVGRAFVVAKAGQAVNEADIITHCTQRLARYKVPKSVRFLEALPKNATGKVDRRGLGGL